MNKNPEKAFTLARFLPFSSRITTRRAFTLAEVFWSFSSRITARRAFTLAEVFWSFSSRITARRAFTLAEVLITLAIIGVVAALTIPTMMANYEKSVLKNQFRKQYSVISQSLQKVNFENPEIGCYYISSPAGRTGSDCKLFFDELFKNIKIVKECKGNALLDGCIPENYPKLAEPAAGCGGYSSESINKYNTAYLTLDGAMFMPYAQNNDALTIMDVNGKKGPNVVGRDIFSLNFYRANLNSPIIFGEPLTFPREVIYCLTPSPTQPPYFMKLRDLF